ncbi:MAG: ParB/RepB/Spo0J family partition protein [Planctomycetota bacterium]
MSFEICPIPIHQIFPGVQPRKVRNDGHIQQLSRSLADVGQLSPIGLEQQDKSSFSIRFGHSRVEAAKLLGWETIDARIYPKESALGESLRMAVVENTVREQLTFSDLADLVTEYAELTGLPVSKAGEKLGFTQGTVSKCVSADKRLTPENKKRLLETGVGGSLAYLISREEDAKRQTELVRRVVSEKWTRKQIEGHFRDQQSRFVRLEQQVGRIRLIAEVPKDATAGEFAIARRQFEATTKKAGLSMSMEKLAEFLKAHAVVTEARDAS